MPAEQDKTAERLDELVAQLTLEEKVKLLTGRDFWTTWPIEKIGLRRLLMSDGPSGVRGEAWDERDPSLNLPSATALAASWDQDIARRYGAAAAVEARAKGVDVVLGPTINLHRSPLGGRHFEAFSEDPVLTSDLAAAYVKGVQEHGVAATPKHYIANDYETDRFTASTEVSDRALRELYLLAFEKSVTEAHAWAIMSSYNSINGVTASENPLLETPLNSEWGFDGIVVSDWTGVRSIESARASQDVAMPGPDGPWGAALVSAVRNGEVPEAAIDRKVRRVLLLAARVGALEGFEPAVTTQPLAEDGVAFVREAEAEGTVLVQNNGILPLVETVSRIAVIGHNADQARSQGGGSATVLPEYVVTPLEGIRAAFPDASVEYALGAVVQEGIAELPLGCITNPDTGNPGVRVRFLQDGREIFGEDRRTTTLVWFGGDAPIRDAETLEIVTRYVPETSGSLKLGVGAAGVSRMWVDDTLILDVNVPLESDDLGAAFLNPPSEGTTIEAVAGSPIAIRVQHDIAKESALAGALSFGFGLLPGDIDPEQLIADAVATASGADIAVVVVGTNAKVESEGYDRTSLALPGRQDDLVAAIAAANPNTIVAVNAGSPVELPWREDVAAVLLTWFGGQEYGNALADVLTGLREPGGRMPTTWPIKQEDVPVINVTPVEGKVRYDEGIHIGYRAWLKSGVKPAYEFGYGLGYTNWNLDSVEAPEAATPDEVIPVTVTVTNTGARAGKQVVQIYAEEPGSAVDRPVRWLVASCPVRAEAGETVSTVLNVPSRLLAYWDNGWTYEPGEYLLRTGFSVSDLPSTATIVLKS